MRETGPVRFIFKGDEKLGQRYVGIARTLHGRMQAYLGGNSGAKTWDLSDGTVIRTQVAGTLNIITITAAPAPTAPTGGYYFVYLFGSFTDEPAQVYGWKIDRESDKTKPIKGMPFAMGVTPAPGDPVVGITPPSGGRVRCSADAHKNGSTIVVYARIHERGKTNPSAPPPSDGSDPKTYISDFQYATSSYIFVYTANPISGKLTLSKSLTSSELTDFQNMVGGAGAAYDAVAWGYFAYEKISKSLEIFATQDPDAYLIVGNNYLVYKADWSITGYGTLGSDALLEAMGYRNIRGYLYKPSTNTVSQIALEENFDVSESRTTSYAINKAGMRHTHPKHKLFYTVFSRRYENHHGPSLTDSYTYSQQYYFRAYSYVTPGGAPTKVSEFYLNIEAEEPYNATPHYFFPSQFTLTDDGKYLIVTTYNKVFDIMVPLTDAGGFANFYAVQRGNSANPIDMTATDWASNITDWSSSSQEGEYLESSLITCKVTKPANTELVCESTTAGSYRDPADEGGSDPDQNNLNPVNYFFVEQADPSTVAMSSNNVYAMRRGRSAARLIDRTRTFFSFGRMANTGSGLDVFRLIGEHWIDIPPEIYPDPPAPTLFEVIDVNIPIDTSGQMTTFPAGKNYDPATKEYTIIPTQETPSGYPNTLFTDRLSGIAIFEPLEGRSK